MLVTCDVHNLYTSCNRVHVVFDDELRVAL